MSWLSSLKSVFSPSQEVNEEAVQKVLQNYLLPNSNDPLKQRITQVNVQAEILQTTLNTYPEEKQDLQQIHDELAQDLQKCAIRGLTMHVIRQKTGPKSHNSDGCGHTHAKGESCSSQPTAEATPSPPPVVDASAQPATQEEADPSTPPIKKAAP